MKIFKLLSILLVLGLIFSVPVMAKIQEGNGFDIPEFSKDGVRPEIGYTVLGAKNIFKNKEYVKGYAEQHNVPFIEVWRYRIDTNGDGFKDLYYLELNVGEVTLENGSKYPAHVEKIIYVGVNEENGSFERILIDATKNNGTELGFDGYYEDQKIIKK